jgi:hypothetical protein
MRHLQPAGPRRRPTRGHSCPLFSWHSRIFVIHLTTCTWRGLTFELEVRWQKDLSICIHAIKEGTFSALLTSLNLAHARVICPCNLFAIGGLAIETVPGANLKLKYIWRAPHRHYVRELQMVWL